MKTDFARIKLLPPYVFAHVEEEKTRARAAGRDVIDFGLGNPDGAAPSAVIDRLCEASHEPANHRYQPSKGLRETRQAISAWYRRRFDVSIDPETEAVATLGSKEGIGHLMLALIDAGDCVVVPGPSYPVHYYGVLIAGGQPIVYTVGPGLDHIAGIEGAIARSPRKPTGLLVCFPHNPTSACEGRAFYERIIAIAKKHNLWVISDLAYADIAFDGFRPPSILQVPGAKEMAVEFFTCSKSYNMPGFRLGFCVGNAQLVAALARIKTYLDYGIFAPIQHAGILALGQMDTEVARIVEIYRVRRDALCKGLAEAGWAIDPPKATMFVWAPVPPQLKMTASELATWLLAKADVAVSPGSGFGEGGEGHVRFSLVETPERSREAAARIGRALAAH